MDTHHHLGGGGGLGPPHSTLPPAGRGTNARNRSVWGRALENDQVISMCRNRFLNFACVELCIGWVGGRFGPLCKHQSLWTGIRGNL